MDLSGLTGMFVGLHVLLSEATQIPEIAVSQDEGKAFMDAAKNVMRHYSVATTQKTIDWIALCGVTGGIYGTRIASYFVRIKNEKAARPPAAGGLVVAQHTEQPRKPNGSGHVQQPVPASVHAPITPELATDPFEQQH